jgi:hypothetical protein
MTTAAQLEHSILNWLHYKFKRVFHTNTEVYYEVMVIFYGPLDAYLHIFFLLFSHYIIKSQGHLQPGIK